MTVAAGFPASAAAPGAAAGTAAGRRARWPYAGFFLLAAIFGWELLLLGRILLPTNPATVAPWIGDVSPEAAAVPSNGLMMDTLIFTLPARVYNGEMLRAGEIPFWNPHVFAGYPHYALIQNNALYPLSALFDLIEPISGMGFSILLHLALAGCLTFAFLRAQGLADAPAFVGAAAFELNGMFLVRISAPSYVFSGTWLPLMLLGALRLARSGEIRAGWPLLIAVTLSVLGGHPQITSLCLTMTGAFLVVEVLATAGERRVARLAHAVGAMAVLVVLGVGVAGFQVVPFLELMGSSARGAEPLEVYRRSTLPFTGLLQAIVPDVFGHPNETNYWFAELAHLVDGIADDERGWVLNYCGQNLYTGLVPPVLAAVAVARSSRRRAVLFLAAVAIASLGILLGGPLLDLAYFTIPGFRHSRPDRVVFLYMSAVALLAAYGFAALAGDDAAAHDAAQRRRTRWQALAVLLVLGMMVAWPVATRVVDPQARAELATWLAEARARWALHAPALRPQTIATAVLALACGALVLAARRLPRAVQLACWTTLLVVPLLLFGWRFNPMQVRPEFGTTAFEQALLRANEARGGVRVARILVGLRQALPANTLQQLGVDDIHGASAAGVGGYLDLIATADPQAVARSKYFRAFRDAEVASTRLLDLLNVGLVLANVELPPPYEPLASEDGVTLYANPRTLPRFFLVEQIERYATPEEGRARLLSPSFDPSRRVLLRAEDDVTLPPSPAGAASSGATRVRVEDRSAHAVRLRVTAPQPAVLVSSEVFYPGWQTRIDGEVAPTLLVNTAFRGVVLPAGEHEVEMVYVPRSFHLGVAVTVVSLLAAALVLRPRRIRSA
ncbi:MAG TPA: hypothetical protein VIS07_09805 [Candidatus Binatia bacterium]